MALHLLLQTQCLLSSWQTWTANLLQLMVFAYITRKQAPVGLKSQLYCCCMVSMAQPSAGKILHCFSSLTQTSSDDLHVCQVTVLSSTSLLSIQHDCHATVDTCIGGSESASDVNGHVMCSCRRDVMQPLSQQGGSEGCRVIAFDRPPYGLSERPMSWPEGPEGNPYTSEVAWSVLSWCLTATSTRIVLLAVLACRHFKRLCEFSVLKALVTSSNNESQSLSI